MSIFDNIVSTELNNGTITQTGQVNPSLNPISDATINTGINYLDPATDDLIRDNRISANTGKLVHNWWISYMKSLKKFFNDTFDDSIVHYEFNYAAKSMLLKRLYSNIQQENPSCIINIDSFTSDSNLDPQRRNSGFYNIPQTTPLCRNYTKNEEIFIDFKFVNLSQTIILNFNDSSDVMNYYDRLTTVYPLNINFISYDYRTFINVHVETQGWSLTDNTEGLIVDAAELGSDNSAGMNAWTEYLAPQRWSEYYSCPTFMINSITQMVDKQNEKFQLQLSLTTCLRVPQTLIVKSMDTVKLQAIQVVMDVGDALDTLSFNSDTTGAITNKPKTYSDGSFKPICIDIDRDIYASYKTDKVLYLDPLINIVQQKTEILDSTGVSTGYYLSEGDLILPSALENIISNKGVALFTIQDSTISKPRMNWSELGVLSLQDINSVPVDESTPYRYYTKEIWDQAKIDSVYAALDANLRPVGPIEILKVKIPDFNSWAIAFEEIGPWFNIRILTFNVTAPDSL